VSKTTYLNPVKNLTCSFDIWATVCNWSQPTCPLLASTVQKALHSIMVLRHVMGFTNSMTQSLLIKWHVSVMYGSPEREVQRSVVVEKYSNSLLEIWYSILSLTCDTNEGIATLVKCFWVGNWNLRLNICNMAWKPGLSTVLNGNMSFAIQLATDFVNSFCSLEDVNNSFYLSHIAMKVAGYSQAVSALFTGTLY